mmetsp:Transcript_68168/g.163579  ORF Transcript_68168/g.163579 Transcript_68168/m.163579 type:complete len:208 (-) Transcript_68168:84-707(-)
MLLAAGKCWGRANLGAFPPPPASRHPQLMMPNQRPTTPSSVLVAILGCSKKACLLTQLSQWMRRCWHSPCCCSDSLLPHSSALLVAELAAPPRPDCDPAALRKHCANLLQLPLLRQPQQPPLAAQLLHGSTGLVSAPSSPAPFHMPVSRAHPPPLPPAAVCQTPRSTHTWVACDKSLQRSHLVATSSSVAADPQSRPWNQPQSMASH